MTEVSTISDLDDVSSDVYEQGEAYIQQLLQEQFPDRNFEVGRTFYWGIVVANALAQGAVIDNTTKLINSFTLKGIRNNPSIADDDIVDLVLSNYYVTREEGSFAEGTATVIVSARAVYTVAAGSVFTVGNRSYRNQEAITAYPQAAQVVGSNDRLLRSRSDGNFDFTIPIQAVESGVAYFAPRGTVLNYRDPPQNVVGVVTATDIAGGTNQETNAELIDRVPESAAAQTYSGENQTIALITDEFPGTKVAVTGMGDPELHRDKANLTGLSGGGMSDVWVATSTSVQTDELTVSAELIDRAARQWRARIPADVVAGIYSILEVRPAGADSSVESLPINARERGFFIPDIDNPPRLFTGMDAAFSPYQTLSIVFTDNSRSYVGLSEGDTAEYDLVAQAMPLITDINSFLIDERRVSKTTNVLVRGAVPCITQVDMVVRLLDGDFEEDIDVEAMRTAIINRLFNIGFDYGVLSVSTIMDAVHDYLTGRSDVGATKITLRGDIIAPSGDALFLSDDQELRIPNSPDLQVTPKNTIFLTDATRINIEFTRVDV